MHTLHYVLLHSREKVRLKDELARAQLAVERCRESIRECVRYCNDAQGDMAIPRGLEDESE